MNIKIIDWIKSAISKADAALPKSGGTMTGTITFNKSGQVMNSPGDDGVLRFDGGSDYNKGAFLSLHGMNHNSDKSGTFQLSCRSSKASKDLIGFPDGRLTWDGKEVTLAGDCLPLTGGTITGNILIRPDKSSLDIGYSYAANTGALLVFRSANHKNPGGFDLIARTASNSVALHGQVDGTLLWASRSVVHTGFKLGSPVWIGSFNVGSTYTAPSLGLFTGMCGGGKSESGSLEVSGTNKIDFTCPDNGWGPLRMPITLVVGDHDVVKLIKGGFISNARFIPFIR